MYNLRRSLNTFAGLLSLIGVITPAAPVGGGREAPLSPTRVDTSTSQPAPAPGNTTFAQQKSAPSSDASQGSEDELVRLSQLWMDATLKRDTKTLEELVADDFMGFFPVRGDVGTREVWMANVRDPNRFQPIEWKYSNIRVRHHGENVAVVSSLARWKGTLNGQPHNNSAGLVDVWRNVRGNGKLSHVTPSRRRS